MVKRCPPGILCIETFSIVCLLSLLALLFFMFNSVKPLQPSNMPTQSSLFMVSSPSKANMPINVPTQRTGQSFSQIGILTNNNNNSSMNTILPLMGKQLLSGRNTWNYYSMSDQNNAIRLPVSFNGKSCMDEYGADELTAGDNVYIDGYNDTFSVTLYEKNMFSYDPIQSIL